MTAGLIIGVRILLHTSERLLKAAATRESHEFRSEFRAIVADGQCLTPAGRVS